MPRSLVLGNGNLLATLDSHLHLRDFYFPYVGMEDHTAYGNFHHIGFYVNGKFSWISDGSWDISINYAKETLVGDSVARNDALQISVHFEDFVYTTHNIFFRKLTLTNLSDYDQEVRVFFHHDFYLYGDKQKDTAQFEPTLNSILHYRGKRYFLVGGQWDKNGNGNPLQNGIDQYTVGKSNYSGKEGTFRDAEDGYLEGNAIDQGSVDSTIRFSDQIKSGKEKTLFCWVAAGTCYSEIKKCHDRVVEMGPQKIMNHTSQFWNHWVDRTNMNFYNLPDAIQKLYKQSLLIIRTQIDNRGAILAATDSDIMSTNRDNYNYMWPRDGALTAIALSEAGYGVPSSQFFTFCQEVLTQEGYLQHKYNPDGSVGSSWHPKIKDGEIQLPIQEDESALVLVALQKHFEQFNCVDLVQKYFNGLVLKIGYFLCTYIDKKTGLPLPSYDLWEQNRAISAYTVACTIAGVHAATVLSRVTGHYESADFFEKAEKKMKKAFEKYFYSQKNGSFLKSVQIQKGKIIQEDSTIDASVMFLFLLGILPPDDPRIVSTMKAVDTHLKVSGNIGGYARFQGDSYHFDYGSGNHEWYPGNPWIITTLWKAEYIIMKAEKENDLQEAIDILQWVTNRATSSGILPEQVHPVDGRHLAVAPLTWSHATFVHTTLLLLKKLQKFSNE